MVHCTYKGDYFVFPILVLVNVLLQIMILWSKYCVHNPAGYLWIHVLLVFFITNMYFDTVGPMLPMHDVLLLF